MTDRFDPLVTSDLITSGYKRYLRSLLPIRDPRIATALDHEITHSELLAKGPLLEATPPYAHGAALENLIQEGVLNPAFRTVRVYSPTGIVRNSNSPVSLDCAVRVTPVPVWIRVMSAAGIAASLGSVTLPYNPALSRC